MSTTISSSVPEFLGLATPKNSTEPSRDAVPEAIATIIGRDGVITEQTVVVRSTTSLTHSQQSAHLPLTSCTFSVTQWCPKEQWLATCYSCDISCVCLACARRCHSGPGHYMCVSARPASSASPSPPAPSAFPAAVATAMRTGVCSCGGTGKCSAGGFGTTSDVGGLRSDYNFTNRMVRHDSPCHHSLL
jgi:hypothetical protein